MEWVSVEQSEPNRDYLGLITYLLLSESMQLPIFLRYVQAIREQLGVSRGLIGYSLRADISQRRFWTLSVWKDESHLGEFVRAAPHGDMIKVLKPHMAETKFVRWKTSGSFTPPSWEDAIERLKDKRV